MGAAVPALKVFAVTGAVENKDIDYAAERADKPTIFVFIQAEQWGRPMAGLLRELDGNVTKEADNAGVVAVWLTDKQAKTKAYLPIAQESLKFGSTALTFYKGETTGPEKWGIDSAPLKTGEFKDSLDPLRTLTDRERNLWSSILDESFQRFVKIIADNRQPLDEAQVKELATGQVFTAEQAKANGLIDEIGDEEVALEALKTKLGLTKARVVEFDNPVSLLSLLLGSAQPRDPESQFRKLLEMSVPRAMYFCGSAPALVPLWQSAAELR